MLPIKIELPELFFDEEVRCGYTVSAEMKKVWAIELDLLSEFIKICEEHHLTYFAGYGTALGAVRHQGFIPWDDDIDVVMPRKDYQKFWKVAANELEYPYFMSCPLTEYRFWRSHIQIRNSETTGVGETEKNLNHNKGIFIDVFPLDNVPDSFALREKHRKKLCQIKWLVNADMTVRANLPSKRKWKFIVKKIITRLFVRSSSYKKAFLKYNQAQAMFEKKNTKHVGYTSLLYSEKEVFEKASFEETVSMPFESIALTVPSGFDTILRTQYGDDYMKIPDKILKSQHGTLFFDTDNSYKKYFPKTERSFGTMKADS